MQIFIASYRTENSSWKSLKGEEDNHRAPYYLLILFGGESLG
jgi:hypothetical protein